MVHAIMAIIFFGSVLCSVIFTEFAWLCVIAAGLAGVWLGRNLDWKKND